MLSWSDDKTLCLWTEDGIAQTTLAEHEERVRGALELHNGWLLSWSDDRTLRLWDTDGNEKAVLNHDGAVNGALELPNDQLLSWSDDGTLRLWTAHGIKISLSGHEKSVEGLQILDGYLISWDYNILRIWSAEGRGTDPLPAHEGEIKGVWALSDKMLLSWDYSTMRLWDVNRNLNDTLIYNTVTPNDLRMWLDKHNINWQAFIQNWEWYALAPERGLLAWRNGNALWLCRAETGEQLATFHTESEIKVARFLQGGEVIALGCANGQVIFLKVQAWALTSSPASATAS